MPLEETGEVYLAEKRYISVPVCNDDDPANDRNQAKIRSYRVLEVVSLRAKFIASRIEPERMVSPEFEQQWHRGRIQ